MNVANLKSYANDKVDSSNYLSCAKRYLKTIEISIFKVIV
jgi:hypothetical protein